MRRVAVDLTPPASDMAMEEIAKQVVFLSKTISNVTFEKNGAVLVFDAPDDEAAAISQAAEELARRVQRGLRDLRRKIVHRSRAADRTEFRGDVSMPGVFPMGRGQVTLGGVALGLYRYFDRVVDAMGLVVGAQPLSTSTLIPAQVLAKCDYFRSFPHNVTFACHLIEDATSIADFRTRHHDRMDLDKQSLQDFETPGECLTPATCYHVYHLLQNQTLPAEGAVYGVCGRCFRYESANLGDLRRLWDFTMREIVFLGTRDQVLDRRDRGIEQVAAFLEEHDLGGEIRTASDPFFAAPDAVAKTYFQISSETKYEVSLMLPSAGRLAVGSLNYHTDFFGRAFNVALDGGGPMHSVCIAFGIERCVHAFLAQHGPDSRFWPKKVATAPEFQAR